VLCGALLHRGVWNVVFSPEASTTTATTAQEIREEDIGSAVVDAEEEDGDDEDTVAAFFFLLPSLGDGTLARLCVLRLRACVRACVRTRVHMCIQRIAQTPAKRRRQRHQYDYRIMKGTSQSLRLAADTYHLVPFLFLHSYRNTIRSPVRIPDRDAVLSVPFQRRVRTSLYVHTSIMFSKCVLLLVHCHLCISLPCDPIYRLCCPTILPLSPFPQLCHFLARSQHCLLRRGNGWTS